MADRQCCEGPISDRIVDATSSLLSTPIAIVWLLLLLADGGFFFFLLIGAADLGSKSRNNWWLNWSIHGLNVLISYAAIAHHPHRMRSLVRLWRIRGTVGLDHEGNRSSRVFDYIPWRDRMFVVVNLNLKCIFQYVNHGFRIKYHSYELSKSGKGALLTTLFFFISFLCAGLGFAYGAFAVKKLRRDRRAPPGMELGPVQRLVGKEEYTFRDVCMALSAAARNPRKYMGANRRYTGELVVLGQSELGSLENIRENGTEGMKVPESRETENETELEKSEHIDIREGMHGDIELGDTESRD